MKILYIVHCYPPKKNGGVELYTSWLMKEMGKGNNLFVFTTGTSEEGESHHGEIKVFTYKAGYEINAYDKYPIFDRKSIKDEHAEELFNKAIDVCRPDIIHVQHLAGMPFSMLATAQKTSIPTLVSAHDFWFLCPRIHFYDALGLNCAGSMRGVRCAQCIRKDTSLKSRLKRMLKGSIAEGDLQGFFQERYQYINGLLSTMGGLLFPSKFVKKIFDRECGSADKAIIMPLGIIPSIKTLEIDGKMNIGYIGAIKPHKGLADLFNAFSMVNEKRSFLHVYGEGDVSWAKVNLNANIRNFVVFHGGFDHTRMNEIYGTLKMIIMPSRCYETFSFVAREALAAGKPVIAPDHSVFPEIIRDGENGYLFEPGSVDSLASKIDDFLSGKLKLAEGDMIRTTTIQEHSRELVDLYRQHINAKKNG